MIVTDRLGVALEPGDKAAFAVIAGYGTKRGELRIGEVISVNEDGGVEVKAFATARTTLKAADDVVKL